MFYDPEWGLSWWMCMPAWGECVIVLLLGRVFGRCQLGRADWWWCSRQSPSWLPAGWISHLLRTAVGVFDRHGGRVCFSLKSHQPHIWHSDFECRHRKGHYVFLENWPLYHTHCPVHPRWRALPVVRSIWNQYSSLILVISVSRADLSSSPHS